MHHIAVAYHYSTGYRRKNLPRGEWQTCDSLRTLRNDWLQSRPTRRSMDHGGYRHFDCSPRLLEQHPRLQWVQSLPVYLALRSTELSHRLGSLHGDNQARFQPRTSPGRLRRCLIGSWMPCDQQMSFPSHGSLKKCYRPWVQRLHHP